MTLTEKTNILSRLGSILENLSKNLTWPGYSLGINEEEYNELNQLIQNVHIYNGWFKEEAVRKALGGISMWLKDEELKAWTSKYPIREEKAKTVAIIMAGNIPLVGFHDFISVFLAGHKSKVKLSSEDSHLFPAIIKTLALFDERIKDWVQIEQNKMEGFEAVIATGSDNSAKYFETYFGRYPHIIRKNRHSIAVLKGSESKEDLFALGHDIFDFYGLGCRNVSQVWIPENFELNRFFEAIYDHNPIINHNKYANNYDYNKAVYLMNQEELLDNGFLLLKEDRSIHSPLAVLHYQRYKEEKEVTQFIEENKASIQVVVGQDYLPFGQAQCPAIDDYADGVDTMAFLRTL